MSEERSESSMSVRGKNEKDTFSPDLPSWVLVFGSLLISWAVIHYYQIEEQLGLVQLFPFVIIGFTLNSESRVLNLQSERSIAIV